MWPNLHLIAEENMTFGFLFLESGRVTFLISLKDPLKLGFSRLELYIASMLREDIDLGLLTIRESWPSFGGSAGGCWISDELGVAAGGRLFGHPHTLQGLCMLW